MSIFTWAIEEVNDASEEPVQNGGEVSLGDASLGVTGSSETSWCVDEVDSSTRLSSKDGGVVAPLSVVPSAEPEVIRRCLFIVNEPRKFLAIALDCFFGVSTFVFGLLCINAFVNQRLSGVQLASSLIGLTFLLATSSTVVHGRLGLLSYVSAISKILHILKNANKNLSDAIIANDNSSQP